MVDIGHQAYLTDAWSIHQILLAGEGAFELMQNTRNPFHRESTIGFVIPADMQATIMVHDVTGKWVWSTSDQFVKGYNQIVINYNDIKTTGVFYYTIKAGKLIAKKRMIMIE